MADEGTPLPRNFSRVVLTLDNVLLDDEKLRQSPSMADGISKEDEIDLRMLGCDLIQTAGILLKLPQTAMATGQVVFQRFYYSKSFVKHNYEILAMACMNVAAKIEESPRRLRDIVNVFHHIKQRRSKKAIKPMILDGHYLASKNHVIKAERRLLKELGFCVHVKHPHKIIVAYLQILDLVNKPNVIQYAWNLMNDSLRTDVFVRYTPETIACACIFLATRKFKIVLPTRPPWYGLFGVDLEDIEIVSKMMMHVYSRRKPDQERLDDLCEKIKAQQLEEKRLVKLAMEHNSVEGTPNSASRTNSPKVGISPNMTLLKKIKTEDVSRVMENGSSEEKNGQKVKRRLDDSEGSPSNSRSHTRSRSSRSRSHSLTPPSKKKKRSHSPTRRHKKDRFYDYDDSYYREKRSHKHKKRPRSRSLSPPSPLRYTNKASKKYGKEKRRSYSPMDKASHRSRKHRNGQRGDVSPRFSDKYRR